MQDLRKIFRYARPYRRDLFAAVGLIFIECIFEMVIPVLMPPSWMTACPPITWPSSFGRAG